MCLSECYVQLNKLSKHTKKFIVIYFNALCITQTPPYKMHDLEENRI
jgi:hypothetical protein